MPTNIKGRLHTLVYRQEDTPDATRGGHTMKVTHGVFLTLGWVSGVAEAAVKTGASASESKPSDTRADTRVLLSDVKVNYKRGSVVSTWTPVLANINLVDSRASLPIELCLITSSLLFNSRSYRRCMVCTD